jgi:UDP-GlcNAc:undecaprenyl-phosphate GlcNAc-1-phosphate transferase
MTNQGTMDLIASENAVASLSSMAIVGLQGFVMVLFLIPSIRALAAKRSVASYAREFHQTHQTAIPRWGGLALVAAFLSIAISQSIFSPVSGQKLRIFYVIVGGAIGMFALGFWDDVRPLGAKRKLIAQILLSFLVYKLGIRIEILRNPFGESINLGAWAPLVTILWLVAMTNLINLIDGIDGLAGGICLLLMLLLAYVQRSMDSFPLLVCGVAGGLIGFLYFNFPPAKIYLGDGGAYFLGFFIGELTITSSHKGTVVAALVAPLFVLALPILDVSLAIVRRGLRGLPIFRPDRKHIHHRLLEIGLSRRRAVLGMYCFTTVFLFLGMVVFGTEGRFIPVLTGIAILIVLLMAGTLSFAREWFSVGRVIGNSLRMREEISYIVLLTRWLAIEGRRVKGVEELWELFAFAADRVGLSYVRLLLQDGERQWHRNEVCSLDCHFAQFDFRSRGVGILEFKADIRSSCEDKGEKRACVRQLRETGDCIGNYQTFEVATELLAEGWHKAARHLQNESSVALRFSPSTEINAAQKLESASNRDRSWFKRLVRLVFGPA